MRLLMRSCNTHQPGQRQISYGASGTLSKGLERGDRGKELLLAAGVGMACQFRAGRLEVPRARQAVVALLGRCVPPRQ